MNIDRFSKSHKSAIFPFTVILLSCIEVFLFSFSSARSQDEKSSCLQSYPPAYCEAVEDAKILEKQEIYPNLTPIVPYNDRLRRDSSGRVLVVAWTTYSGYKENEGKFMELSQEVWVTVVPDLQEFCQAYYSNNSQDNVALSKRLNQLLGLPPDGPGKERFMAELWVESRDLFRPSPDPEITDQEAELDFPIANWTGAISAEYQDWFQAQLNTNKLPWTKLGYTYDWGDGKDWQSVDSSRTLSPHDDVGLSEFVIREGSWIKVASASKSARDYCNPNSKF